MRIGTASALVATKYLDNIRSVGAEDAHLAVESLCSKGMRVIADHGQFGRGTYKRSETIESACPTIVDPPQLTGKQGGGRPTSMSAACKTLSAGEHTSW